MRDRAISSTKKKITKFLHTFFIAGTKQNICDKLVISKHLTNSEFEGFVIKAIFEETTEFLQMNIVIVL